MNSYGKVFLFASLSGVLQGCPKSATLFLFAINPFLLHFEEALKGKFFGEVRACADDLGICFKDFPGLQIAHHVFACAQSLSGMNLKPKKCNTVPLNLFEPAHCAQDVAGARAHGSEEKLGSQICNSEPKTNAREHSCDVGQNSVAADPFVDNFDRVREYIRNWLIQNIPDWQNFKIEASAKYL